MIPYTVHLWKRTCFLCTHKRVIKKQWQQRQADREKKYWVKKESKSVKASQVCGFTSPQNPDFVIIETNNCYEYCLTWLHIGVAQQSSKKCQRVCRNSKLIAVVIFKWKCKNKAKKGGLYTRTKMGDWKKETVLSGLHATQIKILKKQTKNNL